MSTRIPWYDADQVVAEVTPDMARRALRRAIEEGLDPAADPARQAVPTAHGQLLLMPASSPDHAGVKVASVAPGNPELGKPRIQAVYVLLDAQSLTPIALMDGTALTTLRTPAVSAVAVDRLADGAADRLVVFGSGPQAWGHIEAIREIRRLHHVTIVGRDQDHAQALVDKAAAAGLDTGLGQPSDVADADMIVCATSSPTPLFDGSEVAAGACVAAIGAHLPDHRELDGSLVGRSQVFVEDVDTALREAGDVVLAIAEGTTSTEALVPLTSLVTGRASRALDRPNVFKGVGMSWQDLVIASRVVG